MTENKNLGTVSEYEPGEGSVKKKRRSNFIARICSVLLAVILWFYVIRVDSPTYEKNFDYIPIDLSGTQEMLDEYGLSVMAGYGGVLSVTLSGKQSDINRLETADIVASVDLGAITLPGEHHLPVNITTQSGIKVIGYEPTTLEVYVDSTLQKDVEVRPRISYSKEDNVVLGEYVADPARIKISGPASVIETIDHAVTEVDMGKITKSMSGTGTIKLCDKSGNTVTNPYLKIIDASSINVSVPVYKQKYLTPKVKFTNDIIPEKYINVTFSTPVISVQGEAEYIDALPNELVVASIDPKGIAEKSTYEINLETVDDRLEYLDAQTITVDVSLDPQIRDIKRNIPLSLDSANIQVTGFSGTAMVDSPATLLIEARSVNLMKLESLTANDIILHVDLSTVTVSGSYLREAVVEFSDPEVYTTGTYNINFVVEVNE